MCGAEGGAKSRSEMVGFFISRKKGFRFNPACAGLKGERKVNHKWSAFFISKIIGLRFNPRIRNAKRHLVGAKKAGFYCPYPPKSIKNRIYKFPLVIQQ
jgi:hypothetical protein